MRERQPCVYMVSSGRNGTLYIGVTSNLPVRIWQHRNNLGEGFSRNYRTRRLVWYELHEAMEAAILREKALKEWRRAWKLELIEQFNPYWRDLFEEICR